MSFLADINPTIIALAVLIGPAGVAGMVIAYFGKRNQDKTPAALTQETMASIGATMNARFDSERLMVGMQQLTLAVERLIGEVNELSETIRDRWPRRRN